MLCDILAPAHDALIGTDNMTAVLIYFHKNIKAHQMKPEILPKKYEKQTNNTGMSIGNG